MLDESDGGEALRDRMSPAESRDADPGPGSGSKRRMTNGSFDNGLSYRKGLGQPVQTRTKGSQRDSALPPLGSNLLWGQTLLPTLTSDLGNVMTQPGQAEGPSRCAERPAENTSVSLSPRLHCLNAPGIFLNT